MSKYDEYQKPLTDLENRENVSKVEYDYQIKARALSIRVIARALKCVEDNHNHHLTYSEDPDEGYQGSALYENNMLTIRLLKTALGL